MSNPYWGLRHMRVNLCENRCIILYTALNEHLKNRNTLGKIIISMKKSTYFLSLRPKYPTKVLNASNFVFQDIKKYNLATKAHTNLCLSCI